MPRGSTVIVLRDRGRIATLQPITIVLSLQTSRLLRAIARPSHEPRRRLHDSGRPHRQRETWAKFLQSVMAAGRTPRDVFREFIERYAAGETS